MRNLNDADIDLHRERSVFVSRLYGSYGDENSGAFNVKSCTDGSYLRVIAANGGGWDHVSVSHYRRIPNWLEMQQIHRLFFKADETAMELHVPAEEHINTHNNVLHLWRPHDVPIPRPPSFMI